MAEERLAPAQPGERPEARGHPGPLLERGDDREGAEVHDRVGDRVEEEGLDAVGPAEGVGGPRREPDEHVPGVRDRGVGQHPLDVVLGQGDEVAQGHRHRREDDDDRQPPVGQRPERLDEQAQDQGERADLGPDRQEAGDRGR